VISVGNLSVGGSGKTPLVAAIAEALLRIGEQPAVLSRGYARRSRGCAVVIVSDATSLRAAVEESGDEPQLLARRLSGVPVLVSADRWAAGVVAERECGCTVHLLDDGFQHLPLARDVDLLLLSESDLRDAVLPAGRLREPLTAAWHADAWLTPDMASAEAVELMNTSGGNGPQADGGTSRPAAFGLTLRIGEPRLVSPFGEAGPATPGRAVAVAGIARPERFFASAREAGWILVREMVFPDHHWFTHADWSAVREAAHAAGDAQVLTTEKDAVRLERLVVDEPADVPVSYLPIDFVLEPGFTDWLRVRLEAQRA
jgi:tetraacyldisaccharide 4'-kinase